MPSSQNRTDRPTIPPGYTLGRRRWIRLHPAEWAVIALLTALPLVLFYGCQRKYYRNYVGRSEAEVIEVMGPPFYDSRQSDEFRDEEPFNLAWYYWIGGIFTLKFEDGVVVSQSRSSK